MAVQEKFKFVTKPWGGYLCLEKSSTYWLKKLFVKKGEQLSLQSHKGRFELWVVLKGKASVQKGTSSSLLQKGDFIKINKKEKHRILGVTDTIILEVAFGRVNEEDIIRYEDKYDRIKKI